MNQSSPRRFRVLIRGQNLLLMHEGHIRRFGFYTTRLVDGLGRKEAGIRAVELVRDEEQVRGQALNDQRDPPTLFVEEIEEVAHSNDATHQTPGLVLYEE